MTKSPGRAVLGIGILLLFGCAAPELQTRFSPPLVQITRDPWKEAAAIAVKVPNSYTVIGHGRSMEPLYPAGTVLVLQQLRWENLRAGMTAIYNRDPENPYNMVAHVLLKKELDEWLAQGLANKVADPVLVTPKNYVGTVVAAFRRVKPLDAAGIIKELPAYESGTCMLRCHVETKQTLPRTP